MTTAPSIPTMPGQNVGVDLGQPQVNPAWYTYFVGLKKLYDYVKLLQPLDDIVFPHDDTKSDVLRTINTQSGSSHTFASSESGNYFRFTSSVAVSATVPSNTTDPIPVGAQFDGVQAGNGKLSFVAGSGVTINSPAGNLSVAGKGFGWTLVKVGTNEWDLTGTLTT